LSEQLLSQRKRAVEKLKARRNARRSLVSYSQFTRSGYEVNWHHQENANHLEKLMKGEIENLMLFEPPRHGKSEQSSVRFNGYYLGNNPEHSVIECCYSAELARTFSRATRDTVLSSEHQQLWPTEFLTTADSNWQFAGKEDKRPTFIAAGIGGPISGQGAHLLNIDDPIKNAEEADSLVIREGQWNWYGSTARTRLMPQGKQLLTLTRWHEDDIAGRLIKQALADKKADQWLVVVLPATNDSGKEAYTLDTRTGKKTYFKAYKALWPTRYPREVLDRIQSSIAPRWWNALYGQTPTALAGGIIQRAWFKYCWRHDLPTIWERLVQSWDMAFKDKAANSYVCGQVWGLYRGKHFLLDSIREHAGFAKSCQMIRELSERWPSARLKLVEDKANGPAIMESLAEEVGGFFAIEPQGSKPARLEAASPVYMAGDVVHPYPEECSWIASCEEEMLVAPNGTYWDQADCVSQYLNWHRMTSLGPIKGVVASATRQAHTMLRGY
jgi:predicted phage terminase large subunit-like protein